MKNSKVYTCQSPTLISLCVLINVYQHLHEYDRAALKQLEANNDICNCKSRKQTWFYIT